MDKAHWGLTLSTGANYHLPLAVNGFLSWASCRNLDVGSQLQPVASGLADCWGLGPSTSLLSITGTALQHQDMSREEGNSTSQSWQV